MFIELKGVRVNNLKNIDLKLPLGKFIVVTGVSGSGKSSLAFDTLYAEGQRRYVESLSAYARQFLGRMPKPECDYIKGLPPAIAVEQKVNTRNPRSTVGTSTEIYDYMRMLFARIGKTYSPISGEIVKKNDIDDIVSSVMSYPEGTRLAILTEISVPEGRSFAEQLAIYKQEGFSRLEKDGEFLDIDEIPADAAPEGYMLLIDRLSVSADKDEQSRLADSVETAYYEGRDVCVVKAWLPEGIKTARFSRKFAADGMEFREPSDLMFNFNNPYGACPKCEGFGKVMGISEDLVVPDKSLSVYQGAVVCWRGEKMGESRNDLIRVASRYGFPIHTPYCELTKAQRDFLWHGKGEWYGIDGFFRWVDEHQYKIQYRVLKARYRGKSVCPECGGNRLRPDVEYVKIDGHTITELVRLPVERLLPLMKGLALDENDRAIGKRLLAEITTRLQFLNDVGLGYLTLDRLSNSLSGGESQRINLATSLGSSLVGSMYILDEPSIGLHPRDTQRLIGVLRQLQQQGNTVIVVEHDEEIMRAADMIVDIGKDAGSLGGNVMYAGPLRDILDGKVDSEAYTVQYLQHKLSIPVPDMAQPWKKFIEVKGARANNLKGIDVKFPLGVMTMVTGVSGSGKSTLVRDILYAALNRELGGAGNAPLEFKGLGGDISSISAVEFVDQNPIGTSTRSNPATYLKAYDEIRKLYAEQPLARQMGFTPTHFSFNSEGGRCEECKGEGKILIPMQFMSDIEIECEECHGKRFKQDILDVEYRGKNIYDMLEMTIADAVDFLEEDGSVSAKRIIKRLQPLLDVGLGYVKLGQSSSTLSGGENQRVKLAYFLSKDQQPHTMFIFDEPTTGLHFHDISTLLKSLRQLIEKGHTVVIIEHNVDMIRSADWIIDLGPEGGEGGGNVVAEGTPAQIAECEASHTGQFLKMK